MQDPIDDIENYRKYGVYYNPEDPRVVVSKRSRAGWTFNFANWKSYLILAGLFLLIIAVAYFLA